MQQPIYFNLHQRTFNLTLTKYTAKGFAPDLLTELKTTVMYFTTYALLLEKIIFKTINYYIDMHVKALAQH